jgi:signal peptidase I
MDNDIKKTPAPRAYPPQSFVANPTPPTVTAPQPAVTPPAVTAKKQRGSGFRDFISFIAILLVAGGVAVLLISFVFRSYEVDGPSMQTTLYNEDKLIIWKVPRTWARITGHQYVPKRGDIIIFTEDNLSACGQEGSKQLVKRVLGLPGDRVVVANNAVTIYNKANPKGFQPDKTLPYNKDGHIPLTSGNIDLTLGPDQLFVNGDNRPDSCDSRSFGPIQTNQVIGQLVLRLLPANQIKQF